MEPLREDPIIKPDKSLQPQEKMEITNHQYKAYLSWQGEYCDNIPHLAFCQIHHRKIMDSEKKIESNGGTVNFNSYDIN